MAIPSARTIVPIANLAPKEVESSQMRIAVVARNGSAG